ncbi:YchJ family protein [Rhodococcus triatomae]|nr:YchJ family metal-binding protein [Rhodococcus triatomae]
MTSTSRPCPCGLPETYDACCGRFHRGAAAPTAERLMRSRYSAFARGLSDYLRDTWHPRTRPDRLDLDPGDRWTGLDVLATTGGGVFDSEGTVEFVAHRRGAPPMHEHSRFVRDGGRWAYLDGTHRR